MAKPPLNGVAETEYTKSHLRGFSILLKIFFCRLAATSANKVPRPSNYSLATATGSKRPRADSDSLLCHVGLRRTSRELTDSRSERGRRRRDRVFNFGCLSGCEHSEIEFAFNRNGSSWELSNAKRCLASPRQGNADPYKTKPQYTPVAKIKNILFIPSAHSLYPRPPIFFQRACRQCVHESARFPRALCSHAWYD